MYTDGAHGYLTAYLSNVFYSSSRNLITGEYHIVVRDVYLLTQLIVFIRKFRFLFHCLSKVYR